MKITPNQITIARIVALPPAIWALYQSGTVWQLISWLIFFAIAMSDVVDGRLARKSGQITEMGKFLDPVADKFAIGTAMIGLSIQGKLWWSVTAIILFREIGVTILRLSVIKNKGVISASKGGKLKALFTSFGVGFYILPLPNSLHLARDLFMTVGILLTLATGLDYVKKALR